MQTIKEVQSNLIFRNKNKGMPCSAVYILEQKGKVLISRVYRGGVPNNAPARFYSRIMEEEESDITPIISEEGLTFIYVKHNNLYLMAVTDTNSSSGMILLFLYRLIEVFTGYFKLLEEESIRDNFVTVYELLDEVMDFGYPQTTDPAILQTYITQSGYKLQKKDVVVPSAVTGAVNWRSEGISYKKNEVFLDLIESVNLMVASNGTLLRSEIVGKIKMNVKLSGMPELRLGLNDRVQFERSTKKTLSKEKPIEMEDVTFHQCVKLSRFETDRSISFIPPDGEFELMSYRLSTQMKPLIWVEAIVERHSHSRVEYMVKAKAQFKERSTAHDVRILVPVPPNADSPKFKSSLGKVQYLPAENVVEWNIKQFQGGKEFRMRAHFGLPSIDDEENPDKRPPIKIQFNIPYYTCSGLQVKYLRCIEKSGYATTPWVRYLTEAGDYFIRI